MRGGLKNGFTLIELTLILVILAITAVTAIPFFQDVGEARCDHAARKLVSDIAYARRLAQNRNVNHGIIFDPVQETYTLYYKDPATNTDVTAIDPLIGTPLIINFNTLPGLQGVDIQNPNFGGDVRTEFTPQGIPQDGNNQVLVTAGSVVLARGGRVRTITLQPNTGEVSFQ